MYTYIVFSAIDRSYKGVPGLWAYYLNKADRSETTTVIIPVDTLKK